MSTELTLTEDTPPDFFTLSYRVYNALYGLFQAPYAAFAQAIMAELSPPGFYSMVSVCDIPWSSSR